MIYNIVLFLYCLLLAPKLLWERLHGKRHPAFLQRLGFFLPKTPHKQVIWLHAVSVGEVKAAVPFFLLLKQNFPDAWFCVTTTTTTGQEEAKRSLDADAYLYLPLDFSWVAKRFVNKMRPDLFFLVEGDLWPNLLMSVKKRGGKAILISGKMSERSFKRLKRFPFVASKLFSPLDLLCVQSAEHANRFAHFATNVRITGNLKFDMQAQEVNVSARHFLTISSTHALEEELLLDQLKEGPWSIFLAPRHPERLNVVADMLAKKNISFARLSEGKEAKVILVDSMGKLGFCYAQSKIAIVGGSFVPGIGGHNMLEPALYGCPSLFGPHVEGQKELAKKVLESRAGLQAQVMHIVEAVHEIFSDQEAYAQRSSQMIEGLRGASLSTLQEVFKIIRK